MVFGSQALAHDRTKRGPGPRVTICHKPGTPAEKTMMVNLNALEAHLGHRDLEGPCVLIDAHSQFDDGVSFEQVVNLIDQGGISRVILSTRGGREPENAADLADLHPERVIPAVRTKGGAYQENRLDDFLNFLARQVNSDRFKAMAEVLLYHAQKGSRAPKVVVRGGDPRVQSALAHALQQGWPFIVHIEFAAAFTDTEDPSWDPVFPSMGDQFMADLEVLLSENPDHPFVLIHMGQLGSDVVCQLVESHENIYFMTSHANPIVIEESRQPWTNMFDGDRLSPDWEELILEHPRRFILGFDNVFPEHWGEFYLDQIALWRGALKWLPIEVAEAVAHGNAERLWNLPPLE
jgi:predicted TIM-barrel fold metal-dependent hydrolase